MNKKVSKKEEVTTRDLAQMLGAFGSSLNFKIDNLDSKIDRLWKNLDLRITKLENYMKEGFDSLNNKIEYVDARLSNQIEGLGRRNNTALDIIPGK